MHTVTSLILPLLFPGNGPPMAINVVLVVVVVLEVVIIRFSKY